MEFLIQSAEEASVSEESPLLQVAKPLKPRKDKKLQATRWFLTYPKCEATKEQALEKLKELLGENIKGALIAQESHKGG